MSIAKARVLFLGFVLAVLLYVGKIVYDFGNDLHALEQKQLEQLKDLDRIEEIFESDLTT